MAVVEALFKYTSVTQQALRSYDDFTTNKIPQIVNTKFDIESQLDGDDKLTHNIHIHSPVFGEPSVVERDGETRVISSTEAKLRDVTYSIPLYGKVTYTLIKKDNDGEGSVISTKVYDNVHMARIPIMVASSLDSTTKHPSNMECDQDPGGYFIVNGKEKTLIIQETIRPNTVMVFSSKSKGIESVIYPRLDALTMTNCTCKAYVKRDQIYMDTNGKYPMDKYPTILNKVPLSLMLAVVNKTYTDLVETLLWGVDSELERLKIRAFVDPSFDEQIKYKAGVLQPPARSSKKVKAANVIHRAWYNYAVRNPLVNARLAMFKIHRNWEAVVYPHDKQNAGEILLEQIKMLVYTTLGYRKPDSRDSEKNKRLCAAGTLMMTLMADVWNNWTKRLKKTIQMYIDKKKQLRLQKLCDNSYITDSLKYAIAVGNWRAKDDVGGKTGVAQGLNRHTYVSCIAQLRRVDSSVPSDTKVVEPRLLRGDVWGFRCPSATPEGAPNGLVTQLSVAARISVESPPENVAKFLKKFKHKTGKVPMYINGKFYGKTRFPNKAAQFLRQQRRCRTLPIDISVSIVDKKIIVFCDAGRIVRPVFIVRSVDDVGTTEELDNELRSGRMTWDDLLSSGIVEYIDPQETENCLIALRKCEVTPHHTHCEIHCSLILGVMANCIPFPEHNQSPRITYQCAMGKQAVGVYSSNFQTRFDTMANVLHYPQKPLVSTAINEHVSSDLVSGCNAIVAIMIYGGYNQEDSVLINQGSIDRGFGRLTSYRTYTGVDVERGQKKHIFCKDNPSKTTIEDDGLPKPRSWVEQGDVLIGRKVGTRDASIINKKNAGYVDDVLVIQSDQGQTVKVKVRQTRIPELGDKYCVNINSFVLTTQGWVRLKDITLDHKVATLRHGGVLDYVHPTNKYVFDCNDEELYHVKTPEVQITCTKNHKMYVRRENSYVYEFVDAKDVHGNTVRYKNNAANYQSDFVGYDVKTNRTLKVDAVQLTLLARDIVLGFSFPDFVWKFSEAECKRLLSAIKKWKRVSCGTDDLVELNLIAAENVQRLALHCGYSATVHRSGDLASVEITTEVCPLVNPDNAQEKYVRFTGKVGCIEVPETHLFYYKENEYSPPCWTGNSSRHGQKGTVGLIIPEESMPYTKDGIRPDIIISPHALPSRMTVAHVLECLASKVASLNGIRQMATAFEHKGVYDYMEQLHGLGFQKHGDEVMYDGRTGEMLEGKVFIGPTYYQRLKHMVQDKIYSRSNKGHLNQLTRQPCQGRAKGGGLRWGEMERDVGLAYGAAYVLQDRMLKSSDLYSAPVCKECGFVGTHVFREGSNKCCYCGGDIVLCDMPFATKQSLEELMSMGVAPHLEVKQKT